MLIFSHRGHHARIPENTLEAFAEAATVGVDGIESDVRLSADGVPILFHDRIGPEGKEISALSRDALSAEVGYQVPTLLEALEKLPDIRWNLEIKVPAALEPMLKILSSHGDLGCFLITSFWHNVVEECSQRLDVACGVLIAHRPSDHLWPFDGVGPEKFGVKTVVWEYGIVDQIALQAATARNVRNFVYDAKTPEEHRRCAKLRLDGIITDYPEILLGR